MLTFICFTYGMDNDNGKKYMSERILGREMTVKRAAKYIFVSILSGILFGCAAFFAYKLVSRLSERHADDAGVFEETAAAAAGLQPESETEAPETAPVHESSSVPDEGENSTAGADDQEAEEESESGAAAPPDETEGSTDAAFETAGEALENLECETEPSLTEEDVKALITEERKNYELSKKDLYGILSLERAAAADISSYIVTVDSIISETTWFESTIETKRSYSGIIVSKNDQEILVLTVDEAKNGSDNITVTFAGGARQNAIVKKASARDGLLVLAVPADGLGEEFLEIVKPVSFAPAQARSAGEPCIAAGSPMGVSGSFDFGFINYAGQKEETVDGSLLCCYADVNARCELGTFLLDIDGKLIGIAYPKGEEDTVGGVRFVSVQSLQRVIESLKKGTELPYFGISGTDVSFEMKYKNVPEGLYVTDVERDSPAYDAGLKRGDIITMAGEKEIRGTDDYAAFLKNLSPGDETVLTAKRSSGSGSYSDVDLTLTAGIR